VAFSFVKNDRTLMGIALQVKVDPLVRKFMLLGL
jgi:hypothetical protein